MFALTVKKNFFELGEFQFLPVEEVFGFAVNGDFDLVFDVLLVLVVLHVVNEPVAVVQDFEFLLGQIVRVEILDRVLVPVQVFVVEQFLGFRHRIVVFRLQLELVEQLFPDRFEHEFDFLVLAFDFGQQKRVPLEKSHFELALLVLLVQKMHNFRGPLGLEVHVGNGHVELQIADAHLGNQFSQVHLQKSRVHLELLIAQILVVNAALEFLDRFGRAQEVSGRVEFDGQVVSEQAQLVHQQNQQFPDQKPVERVVLEVRENRGQLDRVLNWNGRVDAFGLGIDNFFRLGHVQKELVRFVFGFGPVIATNFGNVDLFVEVLVKQRNDVFFEVFAEEVTQDFDFGTLRQVREQFQVDGNLQVEQAEKVFFEGNAVAEVDRVEDLEHDLDGLLNYAFVVLARTLVQKRIFEHVPETLFDRLSRVHVESFRRGNEGNRVARDVVHFGLRVDFGGARTRLAEQDFYVFYFPHRLFDLLHVFSDNFLEVPFGQFHVLVVELDVDLDAHVQRVRVGVLGGVSDFEVHFLVRVLVCALEAALVQMRTQVLRFLRIHTSAVFDDIEVGRVHLGRFLVVGPHLVALLDFDVPQVLIVQVLVQLLRVESQVAHHGLADRVPQELVRDRVRHDRNEGGLILGRILRGVGNLVAEGVEEDWVDDLVHVVHLRQLLKRRP